MEDLISKFLEECKEIRLIDSSIQTDSIIKYIITHKERIISVLQKGDYDFLFALMMEYFDKQMDFNEGDDIRNPIRICSFKKDKNKKMIYSGDVLKNDKGQYFEVRYGSYAMYCPVDNAMEENVGFYVVIDGIYEDMPLGPTEEYATIVGNIVDNPEYKVDKKYRCQSMY
ncbi:MAG: hypothetical protein HFJ09_09470 [Lachnospiraceae bacterium]|nr:hypothetical protein [Lachnospiraceae bacterium]